MSSVDLNALRSFAAVAEAGGFTAAADRLGVAKAKLSLDVKRLEAHLGAALFTRTTRRVALTEAGRTLHAQAQPALLALQDALGVARSPRSALNGTLRVACLVDQAARSVGPALAAFAALHPQLQVELRSSDRVADLIAEGIDVALRAGWLRDSSLRAVRLGSFEQFVVASPAYLRRAGVPTHPSQLAEHDWVALTLLRSPLTWTFESSRDGSVTVRLRSRARTDSIAGLRALLEAGTGISIADQGSVAEALRAGRLQRVLQQWELPRGGVHAVLPPARQASAAARAFVAYYRGMLERGDIGL